MAKKSSTLSCSTLRFSDPRRPSLLPKFRRSFPSRRKLTDLRTFQDLSPPPPPPPPLGRARRHAYVHAAVVMPSGSSVFAALSFVVLIAIRGAQGQTPTCSSACIVKSRDLVNGEKRYQVRATHNYQTPVGRRYPQNGYARVPFFIRIQRQDGTRQPGTKRITIT